MHNTITKILELSVLLYSCWHTYSYDVKYLYVPLCRLMLEIEVWLQNSFLSSMRMLFKNLMHRIILEDQSISFSYQLINLSALNPSQTWWNEFVYFCWFSWSWKLHWFNSQVIWKFSMVRTNIGYLYSQRCSSVVNLPLSLKQYTVEIETNAGLKIKAQVVCVCISHGNLLPRLDIWLSL